MGTVAECVRHRRLLGSSERSGAMRRPVHLATLLLVLPALAIARDDRAPGSDPGDTGGALAKRVAAATVPTVAVPTVAVLSEAAAEMGTLVPVIRVAFAKKDGLWEQVAAPPMQHGDESPSTRSTPRPAATTWHVCADGHRLGVLLSTPGVDLDSTALAGAQKLAPGQLSPLRGSASLEFGGWTHSLVHRPLVLASVKACSDPEGWSRQRLPSRQLARVIPLLREAVKGISGCGEDGHSLKPYNFPSREVVVGESYASSRGDALVTLSVRQRKALVGTCDGPLGEEWMPHTFSILRDGTIRHLGSSLRVIGVGDYDADGRSEFVFFAARYNHDGYWLFANHFRESASFGWSYN